ncbi:MAG: small basic protein [Phycisphaerae bacterium]|nr:small basic protein [Phycisphaerae bacterium]
MSVDRSLKIKDSLSRHRNVLTRAERIQILQDQERFSEEDSPFNLPKVAHRKVPVGGRVKKASREEGEKAAEATPKAEQSRP